VREMPALKEWIGAVAVFEWQNDERQ